MQVSSKMIVAIRLKMTPSRTTEANVRERKPCWKWHRLRGRRWFAPLTIYEKNRRLEQWQIMPTSGVGIKRCRQCRKCNIYILRVSNELNNLQLNTRTFVNELLTKFSIQITWHGDVWKNYDNHFRTVPLELDSDCGWNLKNFATMMSYRCPVSCPTMHHVVVMT